MRSISPKREVPWLRLTIILVGGAVFPLMTALLFNAGAEALFGTKEPLFETMLGLFIGAVLAGALMVGAVVAARRGFERVATVLTATIIVYDVLAIPLGRLLVSAV